MSGSWGKWILVYTLHTNMNTKKKSLKTQTLEYGSI